MRQTAGKVFLDSNIVIYSYSSTEVEKRDISRNLIEEHSTYISTQVLQEVANTLFRKFRFRHSDIRNALEEMCRNNYVHTNTENTILLACQLIEKYKLSFYDSMIVSAALECEADILYTEDLNNGQAIENRLQIVNPFLKPLA